MVIIVANEPISKKSALWRAAKTSEKFISSHLPASPCEIRHFKFDTNRLWTTSTLTDWNILNVYGTNAEQLRRSRQGNLHPQIPWTLPRRLQPMTVCELSMPFAGSNT
eukprot:IDg4823t1